MNEVRVYRVLQAQGFTDENANEFVQALHEGDRHASHADILLAKNELKEDIAQVKLDLSNVKIELIDRINAVKNSTALWVGTATAFLTLVMTLFRFYR